MFKKVLALCLTLLMIVSTCAMFASCDNSNEETFKPVAKEDLKIGMICLHDDSSTYDKNFIDAMYRAIENLGLSKDQLVMYTGIPESEEVYNKAKACITQGCQMVFADSFGHEDFLIQAVQEYPSVHFAHATGTKAHTLNCENYTNAFAAIYEGRYAAGVAAGLKLNEMITAGTITADQAIMGYVGAYTYAEVMSGYTSFYLGAKSVCPSVTMKVKFTGTWYDFDKEKAAAEALIAENCVLISQHADSLGAPKACEDASVPNIAYNGSTETTGPNTFIVYSKINWTPFFEYMINCTLEGKAMERDWTGTIATGSVVVDAVNTKVAAEGTQAAIDDVIAKFKAGTLNVYDVNNFTVGGEKLTSYKADVDYDDKYTKDTEVIENGVFMESKFRSAPYFDIEIDGITLLDRAY